MRTIQTITLLLSLLIFSAFAAKPATYKIIRNDPQVFQIKIQIEKPVLKTEAKATFAALEQASYVVDDQGFYLPKLTRLINLASVKNPLVKIISKTTHTISVQNYRKGPVPKAVSLPLAEIAQARYLGKYNQVPLFALDIFPVKYLEHEHKIEYLSELEIAVVSSSSQKENYQKKLAAKSFLSKSLVDANKVYLQSTQAQIATAESGTSMGFLFSQYSDLYKIGVKEEGIYKITYEDLFESGYPVETVNPLNLHLFNGQNEVPVFFVGAEDGTFDEGDYLEFWGTGNQETFRDQFPELYKDPFSDINIYWLGTGMDPGYRMSEESGRLVGSGSGYIFQPYAYTEKIHFEKDNHFERFGHTSSGVNRPSYEVDHWYFDSGISAPEGIAYEFYVPHPFESGSNVVITAALRGRSYYNNPTNLLIGHQVDLKLRGKNDVSKLIGRVTPQQGWRDQNAHYISNADSAVKLSQTVLENGINRLEVDMFQTGVTDIVLMNWFEIEYLRKYRAYEDYIKFHVDRDFFNNSYVNLGDNIQINVDGFSSSDISLYKLGVSKIVNAKIGTVENDNRSSIGISFQDEIYDPDIEYVAVTEQAKKRPLSIQAYRPWIGQQTQESLRSISRPIDYLIITHNLFYETAQKLVDLKTSQGMHPLMVTVENIYDVFNNGIKSPLAIKDFIRYAKNNWSQGSSLQYVVFVGKASYDYKDRNNKETDLVPTFMYQTEKYGAAGSDFWYALLDEDDYIPDVTVARIPASTNQELLNYIDKIEHYGQPDNTSDEWINRALFISGNDAGSGDREYLTNAPIFRAQNLRLLNQRLPAGTFTSRLNTVKDENISGYDPTFGSTTDLIEYFDEGLSFINFLGHGGGGIWADVNLLNLSDIDRLNNGYKLPFVASMTCFTGAFENPNRLGLAEKLLLSEQKGAIAILAASGVGWKYNDFAVDWHLFDFLWDKNLTFGQAIDLMKIYYLANAIYVTEEGEYSTFSHSWLMHSMVSQYNLLGDPALKLNQPQSTVTVSASDLSPAVGDTVVFSVSGSPLSDGTAHFQIVTQKDSIVYDNYSAYSAEYTVPFEIPENSAGNFYRAKLYIQDGTQNAAGSVQFFVERPIVSKLVLSPAAPEVGQQIQFELHTQSHYPITKMELTNFRNENQSYGDQFRLLMSQQNDTTYKSTQAYAGFASGGQKYFDIYIEDDQEHTTIQRRMPLTIIDSRPDVLIKQGSLSYSGSNSLQLNFMVVNASDSSLKNVSIHCYDQAGIETESAFAVKQIDLPGKQQQTVVVNYDTLGVAASRIFKIELDPENNIIEQNEFNNVLQTQLLTDHIYVDRVLGTSQFGIENDTIKISSNWNFFIPANELSASAVLRFNKVNLAEFFKGQFQSGLKLAPIRGAQDTSGIELTYPQQLDNTAKKITLSARLDREKLSADDLAHISLFRYDAFLNLWLNVGRDSLVNDHIYGTVNQSGRYALFNAADDREPTIEVTANGRPMIKDMLLVRKPLISFLLQDENGVNFTNSLNVNIDDVPLISDGKPQLQHEVSIPDSLQNARAIAITANPSLEAGTHNLTIEVADVNGNLARSETQFVVTGDFFLEVHGNYPNPFSEQTIIAYTVTSDNDMDDFSIKIYTTSGRLIRKTMLPWDDSIENDNIYSNNYHELVWDGTDDDGNQVANGVYFMVIQGKFKGKTVKKTLKIARLR